MSRWLWNFWQIGGSPQMWGMGEIRTPVQHLQAFSMFGIFPAIPSPPTQGATLPFSLTQALSLPPPSLLPSVYTVRDEP